MPRRQCGAVHRQDDKQVGHLVVEAVLYHLAVEEAVSLKDHGGATSELGRREHPGVRRGAVGEPVHPGEQASEE